MMIRSLVIRAGGVLAAAALAFSFSAAPVAAATLNLNFPDTCTLSGSAPNLTLTCNSSGPGPGAPTCSISSSAPSNTLPAGGGAVTVTMSCSGGTAPYTYSWNTGDSTSSISKNISLTTQFTATVTDAAGQRNSQSLTVTVSSGGGGGGGSIANCTNQGYSVMGGNAIPITWGGQGQTFFSTAAGSFGDSQVWLFTMTPTAASAGYGRMVVSEYGGNAYTREISVSTTPCDWNLNPQPPLIAGGSTASVYFGAYSGSPSYPWVLAPGTTYYVSIRNFNVSANSPSCGQGNCQAILNVAPAN